MTKNSKIVLSAMPYAQAHIEKEHGTTFLISYTTVVAAIDSEGWLSINGLYSMTTRRHIGAFVKEYANTTYQTAKQIYEDSLEFNIHTGEVRPY